MASLLSWLGGAAKRVGHDINNDVVKPIQRDVIRPVLNAPQTINNDIVKPIQRDVVRPVLHIPQAVDNFATKSSIGRGLQTAGLGALRSGVGTVQGVAGLDDALNHKLGLYEGPSPFSKGLNRFASNIDQTAKAEHSNKVLYHGSQATTDALQFLVGGAEVKALGKAVEGAPKIARVVKPVVRIANAADRGAADLTKDLRTGSVGQRVVGNAAKNILSPKYQAVNAGFTALQTGKQVSQGQKVTPHDVATNLAIGGVGFPIAGAVGGEVVRPVIKGAQNTAQLAKNLGLKRPTNLTDDEIAASKKVLDARSGLVSGMDITSQDSLHFHNAQKKLGAQPGTPDGIMAVDRALGQHRTFDTQLQQRVQALQDVKQKAIDFNKKHPIGMSMQAVDGNGNPMRAGKAIDPLSQLKQEALKYKSADEFRQSLQKLVNKNNSGTIRATAIQFGNKAGSSGLTNAEQKLMQAYSKSSLDYGGITGKSESGLKRVTDLYNQAHAEAKNPEAKTASPESLKPTQGQVKSQLQTAGKLRIPSTTGDSLGGQGRPTEKGMSFADNTTKAGYLPAPSKEIKVKARGSKNGVPVKVTPYDKPNYDFTQWQDKTALGLGRDTMERNLQRVAGKDAPAVNKLLVESSRANETARVKFANDLRQSTKDYVVKGLGIKPKSYDSELVQKYGEKMIDVGDVLRETGGNELKTAKIIEASDYFRKQYDQLIDDWNVVRKKYGYDPIPKRADYFRHFQAIEQNAGILGTIKNARDLPTEISGITDIFNPTKPFSDAALQRKGNKTTFDAVSGFDNYINSVSKQIYHTDTVQKGRALEGAIRKAAADNPAVQLPNFVSNLHEWTNLVSGKKTRIDRASEELIGRKVYAAADWIKRQTGANMIGANLSSAMTNFVPFTQSLATTSKPAATRGIADTLTSAFAKDPTSIDGVNSGFLTRRYPKEAIVNSGLRKASEVASTPFRLVDEFTSRSIVAGKYFENRAKGLDKQAAMKAADDYASRVLTDRSAGQLPNLINVKTAGPLVQFQAEVNNQVSFLMRDIPHFAGGNKAKIASSLTQFVVYSYLANEAYQHIMGRRVQLDPIHAVATIANPHSTNDQRKNAVEQDILGGLPFTSIFTGGRLPASQMFPDVPNLAKGTGDLVSGDKGNGAREIYKGVSGPVFYGLPPFGGGQAKKTIDAGLSFAQGQSVTPTGKTRFDQPATPANVTRGLLFGQYATDNGQKYINNLNAGAAKSQSASANSVKAQANRKGAAIQTGIYQVKGKDGSPKFATLQGKDLKSYKTLDDAKEAQAKNIFRYSKKTTTTINGQMYHKSPDGKIVKGAPPAPKVASTPNTVYDAKSNTWTKTTPTTGKVVQIKADGTQTVVNPGIGQIRNARPDYVSNIRTLASKYNLDANAVMAVAATEGLGGGVGDNGTSFGPFQMHIGGALPQGKDQAWAESPEGIDYALQLMSKVASGLQGQDAINAIVSSFEKPLDPNSEIANALAIYSGKTATLKPGTAKSTKISNSKNDAITKLASAINATKIKKPSKPAKPNITVKTSRLPNGYQQTALKKYTVSKVKTA